MGMLKCGVTDCQRTFEQGADPSAVSGAGLILSSSSFLSHNQPLCKAFDLHLFPLAVFREMACHPGRPLGE